MALSTALGLRRHFTKAGKDPYNLLDWVKVDSAIVNPMTGKPVFEQKQVEFPDTWSQNAINIVAQKYFWGELGTKERESSLKHLINRVVDTITRHGTQEGYFVDKDEAQIFSDELKYILASQRASFNSPVWFNIGAADRAQQASACFILDVDDDMKSILNWYYEEGMIFKGGSGSGVNLSKLRSSYETLASSSGTASGPVSFMRGSDSSAGTIKSGGKTRRAAKMVILNVDHPDIEEFVWCKAIEERKSRVLEQNGFDMSLDGKDAFSVQYQNANNSVRVTDDFMAAVENDGDWDLKAVTTGKTVRTVKAKELMHQIAESAWECADPGMQYDTTINRWHTTPNAGRINGSNPCSEYMHLDNSACNLASINLLKYLNEDGSFDVEAFKHTVELIFSAQEILVGYSSYPTEPIGENAVKYRELGLGYANLGAMLMAKGLPYDSDEGRAVAAAVTSLMTGHAYATSAKLARRVGPFAGYSQDRVGMNKVLKMHQESVRDIDASLVPEELLSAAAEAWDEAVEQGERHGVRNSQASVLAPTGTIGLMMDCDTTGIEPDLGLIKVKSLVGGGTMTFVNRTVPRALKELGYTKAQVDDIVAYIDEEKTIKGAPHLDEAHLPVFACAMGDNPIHYNGHIRMMGAVQPFLSGAISKTVNMPEEVGVDEVEQLYIDSWKLGLKAVAIYRDGSKVGQPLHMAKKERAENEAPAEEAPVAAAASPVEAADSVASDYVVRGMVRKELPRKRTSQTYRFEVADLKGYFTVGEYEDGTPGELFISVAKQGSTLSGMMDAFAISISHGLQYGVPLYSYARSFMNMTFAPYGVTDDPEVATATSIIDYIFKRLAKDYLSFDQQLGLGLASLEDMDFSDQASLLDGETEVATVNRDDIDGDNPIALSPVPDSQPVVAAEPLVQADAPQPVEEAAKPKSGKGVLIDPNAPLCFSCGNQTQRSGSCYVCTACGATTGCS